MRQSRQLSVSHVETCWCSRCSLEVMLAQSGTGHEGVRQWNECTSDALKSSLDIPSAHSEGISSSGGGGFGLFMRAVTAARSASAPVRLRMSRFSFTCSSGCSAARCFSCCSPSCLSVPTWFLSSSSRSMSEIETDSVLAAGLAGGACSGTGAATSGAPARREPARTETVMAILRRGIDSEKVSAKPSRALAFTRLYIAAFTGGC